MKSRLVASVALSLAYASAALSVPEPASAQGFGLAQILDPGSNGLVVPRHPGKPDPRWKVFDWKYTDLGLAKSRMRLFYHQGEEWTARYAAPEILREISDLEGKFGYSLTQPFSYLLFSSHRFFQQTNVFYISEGVQGVTSTVEPIMAIPYWGQAETYRHISTHEMVHQFEVQKMNDLSEGRAGRESALPLWFIEGMAEYYSLQGVDPESSLYLRDLMLYPDPAQGHKPPGFFEEGGQSFVSTYKAGQAKIDFLERTYGRGAAQRVLESSSKPDNRRLLPGILLDLFKDDAKAVEEKWSKYLASYKAQGDQLTQPFESYEEIQAAGDTIDSFAISPDGKLLLTRQIDPIAGITSIRLLDAEHGFEARTIDEDSRPDTESFSFMQYPVLAIGDQRLAYVVTTTGGPELEVAELRRQDGGEVGTAGERRIKLHRYGIIEASSPTLSPDEKSVAFVGLDAAGRESVYTLSLSGDAAPVRVSGGDPESYYSVREPNWTRDGILVSSDRTNNARYGIFVIDPTTRRMRPVVSNALDELSPSGGLDDLYFQSWGTGTSQVHRLKDGKVTRLTDAKTALFSPRRSGEYVYFLGFKGGRYHLYRQHRSKWLSLPVNGPLLGEAASAAPWTAQLATIRPESVNSYKPISWNNLKLDQLAGFFGSGGVIGVAAHVSDMMNEYGLDAQFTSFGAVSQADSHLLFTSQRGRSDVTFGPYYVALPRIDPRQEAGSVNYAYLNREFGLLGSYRYPFTAFSYGELLLTAGRTSRSDYTSPYSGDTFSPALPGSEWVVTPGLRLGLDRVLYETFTGPIGGYSILASGTFGRYFSSQETTQRYRLDLSYYWRLLGPTVLAFEGVAGTTRGQLVDPFYVSSDDLLRAYSFGDIRLLGNNLVAGRAELRFPIGLLFKFPFLRGLLGVDYGSVFNTRSELASGIAAAASAGALFNLPPLSVGFVWSKPLRQAPGPTNDTVFHFMLRYLYF